MNPQYAFGWAVPLLCAYLVWRDLSWTGPDTARKLESGNRASFKKAVLGIALALGYAPTRLIQEANPEWRLVSWALAIEVIGLTWLMLPLVLRSPNDSEFSPSRFSLSAFSFLFFLVAVPWPTMVERPVIRTLTALTAQGTAATLGLLGVPALLHGSVIEVGSGLVGIDEACSGIRSFQAALMLALFFGELYRLKLDRRLLCVLAGFGFAILFNLLRATLLALIAVRSGSNALAAWHDPAGLSILLGCFTGIWLLAMYLCPFEVPTLVRPKTKTLSRHPASTVSWAMPPHAGLSWALISWILFVEFGTESWYRLHERSMATPVRWHPVLARGSTGIHELGFTETSRRLLRFNEGLNASWREGGGLQWQAIFLRWAPGRVAVHLANNHTPEDCLTAAGHRLVAESGLHLLSVDGLKLPFRCYVTRDETGPVHVFYCLWEDRAAEQFFESEWLSYGNRLRPVLAGRRNCGQRSLELALWGAANDREAEQALGQLLPKIIQIEN